MRYGSVCSGIEAASVAWDPLGWEPSWFSEIEPFPSAVLAHRFPTVHNHGDFTKIRDGIDAGTIEAPDVLVGGTPCQAFSIAGLRNSLDDARGQLSLEFVRLADAIDRARHLRSATPSVIVWENVPGVLSTSDNAFGCFLAGLAGNDAPLVPPGGQWLNAGCVFGPKRTAVWRILDAQFFGVAQRRRRVFVVASSGDFDPCKVLFEFDSVRRDSPPIREKGKGFATVAGTLSANGDGTTRPAGNCNELDFLVPQELFDVQGFGHNAQTGLASTLKKFPTDKGDLVPVIPLMGSGCENSNGAGIGSVGDPAFTLDTTRSNAVAYAIQERATSTNLEAGPQGKDIQADVAYTIEARHHVQACAFEPGILKREGGHFYEEVAGTLRKDAGDNQMAVAVDIYNGAITGEVAATLTKSMGTAGASGPSAMVQMQVRRLTPIECARLQGFPDNWTQIPWRGKPAEECPDGPQYKAYGNSMAVPVMHWIGQRIQSHIEKAI